MSQVTLKGNPVKIGGTFPEIGDKVSNFTLTANDLKEISLDNFSGQNIVLNIFPSVDTSTCAESVRNFNKAAANLKNTKVLCISKDLPFAQARFCGAEGINNVQTLSAFRNPNFAQQLGVDILSEPLLGLLARAVIVLDPQHKVIYTELVSEITEEPNYDKCLHAMT